MHCYQEFDFVDHKYCVNTLLNGFFFLYIDFFRLLLEWHAKFGDTYQLWIGLRPFIAMADADHIKVIFLFINTTP